MRYRIFGKNIQINIYNIKMKNIIKHELQEYPETNKEEDLNISFTNNFPQLGGCSNSPKIHTSFRDAFLSDFGNIKILYHNDVKLHIYIDFTEQESFISKFRTIGFTYNYENIGQILHELVLVPLNFFNGNRALIHTSTMKSVNGRTIMFGGTGGVGKTSLEILLCSDLNYSFISDDIAIVSREGSVYPNLAYPKIYAYNVENNDKMKKILFENRNYMDRFQWEFMQYFKGLSRVRRAISPREIYNTVEIKENHVDDYYVLFRTNTVETIIIEELSSHDAIRLTWEVIKNEYQAIFQHIVWHEYNCQLMSFPPIITMKQIEEESMSVYRDFFKTVQCYSVKIPMNIKHDDFLNQMKYKFK